MAEEKNILIPGWEMKPIAMDFFASGENKPAIMYAHGFNGFKDWGNFDLIAKAFVQNGFSFIKFNFSHNGTSPSHPEEFVDPEAFGHNNFSKQLYDLTQVINWVAGDENPFASFIDRNKIFLIGHSMGGGIVLLGASVDLRIKAVATWASIAESKTPWGRWDEEKIKKWKKGGVMYYLNGRTKQQLPLYYQLYEDYRQNHQKLDVLKAAAKLGIPLLIVHGKDDEAVPVEAAHLIHEQAKNSTLLVVPGDHVFGRKHPWKENYLPEQMKMVVEETIKFFQEQSRITN